jgi:hypothetical protein
LSLALGIGANAATMAPSKMKAGGTVQSHTAPS